MHDTLALFCLAVCHCFILYHDTLSSFFCRALTCLRLCLGTGGLAIWDLLYSGNVGTKHLSEKLIRQSVKARYDWYMQAAGLTVQLHKTGWKEKPIGDNHHLTSKIVAATKEVQTES